MAGRLASTPGIRSRTLMPHMPALFERARVLGLSTSLDTNWDPAEAWAATLSDLFPLTDLFLPNEQEARYISGLADLDAAAARFRARGVRWVAIKCGTAGAAFYDERGRTDCMVSPATGGDSVGTGDSFDAGFLAGWLREMRPEVCLKLKWIVTDSRKDVWKRNRTMCWSVSPF
ncbi:MAG: bifunctional hydroxymethylpyrimidine kinase/phosphomethylpyrimidine kinase [Anaerolineae bacterium]|nr:bifunctional hydroxymethylpyrimidine kinase/phosphomethylpyrimidine kinase [Anaerolineae bacterium]